MSSFFTLPASQRKRKRSQPDAAARSQPKNESSKRKSRDESISGSEASEDEALGRNDERFSESGDEDEDDPNEDPAAKRLRLAEQYIENTQKAILEDVGFDAADVDADNLRRRTGERLKEDTAEGKGKLYRWIAEEYDWSSAHRAQFRCHQKAVTGVAIAGDYIYTVGKDSVLVKWQLPPTVHKPLYWKECRRPKRILVSRHFGKQRRGRSESHTGAILCVAASQDGRFVATGGADKKLVIWDASNLQVLKVFPQHRDSVISLAFRRGTNQLFSASKDRTVKIWSLDELTYVETLFGHQDEVVDVSALAQEKCVSVGARDRTARLWKVVEESQLVYRGGGGKKLKAMLRNGDVGNLREPESIAYHEGSMDRVVCIDDEHFVTGSDNGALSLWNVRQKKAIFTYPLAHGIDTPPSLDEVSAELEPDEAARPPAQPRWITALTSIPFSNIIVSGSWDGFIRAWKISPDKRRIEPLGRIGCVDETVESLLDREGLSSSALSNGALQALVDGTQRQGRARGCINDLAIVDRGEKTDARIVVLAAVGKELRLGRWAKIDNGQNRCILLEISKKKEVIDSQSESTASNMNGSHDATTASTGIE